MSNIIKLPKYSVILKNEKNTQEVGGCEYE